MIENFQVMQMRNKKRKQASKNAIIRRRKSNPELIEFGPVSSQDVIFSSCKDFELSTCYYYEITRHLPLVRQAVAEARRQFPGKTFEENFQSGLLTHIFGSFHEHSALYPEWPEFPYLSVPVRQRKQRFEQIENWKNLQGSTLGRGPIIPFPYELAKGVTDGPVNFKTNGIQRIVSRDGGEFIHLFIEWDVSDDKLATAFREFIHEWRPVMKFRMRRTQGNSSHEAQIKSKLKGLAAWRILTKYKYAEIPAKYRNYVSEHCEQSDWYKKERDILKELNRLNEVISGNKNKIRI